MALFNKEPIHILPKGVEVLRGSPYGNIGPFSISVLGVSPTVKIKISKYSSVLNSPNIKDKVPLVGVDAPVDLKYGDKLWLEIFYDRNLAPVFALVNSGPKWKANVAGGTGNIPVYPEELEFITKKDLSSKITELSDAVSVINTIKQNTIDEINAQFSLGFISQEQKSASLDNATNSYQVISDNLIKYRQNMNQFFVASPNATFKKLFRSYTLLAFTTKNTDPNLTGIIVHPPNVGQAQQNGVNTATDDAAFKIVPTVNFDLLLADICYQNRYAARLPIPYHRPIYPYIFNGKDEEATAAA